jgi:hypothetical protein
MVHLGPLGPPEFGTPGCRCFYWDVHDNPAFNDGDWGWEANAACPMHGVPTPVTAQSCVDEDVEHEGPACECPPPRSTGPRKVTIEVPSGCTLSCLYEHTNLIGCQFMPKNPCYNCAAQGVAGDCACGGRSTVHTDADAMFRHLKGPFGSKMDVGGDTDHGIPGDDCPDACDCAGDELEKVEVIPIPVEQQGAPDYVRILMSDGTVAGHVAAPVDRAAFLRNSKATIETVCPDIDVVYYSRLPDKDGRKTTWPTDAEEDARTGNAYTHADNTDVENSPGCVDSLWPTPWLDDWKRQVGKIPDEALGQRHGPVSETTEHREPDVDRRTGILSTVKRWARTFWSYTGGY